MPTPIPRRTWFVIILLGLAGQVAWAVENTWFNTFVYDSITPNPSPVAWMVAVSAITATLTSFVMGAFSDRMGRRKPFLVFGYIAWGISTVLFPGAALIKVVSLAVFAAILLDALMTFFGSTANDAAYNAWLTDITDQSNRSKVMSIVVMMPILVTSLTAALGGLMIDSLGYFPFFFVLGGFVLLAGLICTPWLEESPALQPAPDRRSIARQLRDLFSWQTLADNPTLFLIFLYTMLASIGHQVNLPYVFIYLENFLGLSKTTLGLVMLTLTLATGVLVFIFGQFIDRWDRRRTLLTVGLILPAGMLFFSFLRTVPQLLLFGLLYLAPWILTDVISSAWRMDLYPADSRGQFQGVRLVFVVMLPMIIGPAIGSTIITRFGIPTISNGQAGFIPSPAIFWGSAIINLLALIPVLFVRPERASGNLPAKDRPAD